MVSHYAHKTAFRTLQHDMIIHLSDKLFEEIRTSNLWLLKLMDVRLHKALVRKLIVLTFKTFPQVQNLEEKRLIEVLNDKFMDLGK